MAKPSDYFCEFHVVRNGARAGQERFPIKKAENGKTITRKDAINQVRNGKDVYTEKEDAARLLAEEVYNAVAKWHPPHETTGFQHFHPAGKHRVFHVQDKLENLKSRPRADEGPGHVFFGARGEKYDPSIKARHDALIAAHEREEWNKRKIWMTHDPKTPPKYI